MMAAFSQVIHCAAKEQSDANLGTQVRTVLDNYGGVEALLEQYNQVSAYHNNNYLPLLWNIHRQHRAALFRLLKLLDIRSATQDTSILDAIHWVVEHQNSRKDFLSDEINLDFMSHRWRVFVQTRQQGQTFLKRRELEIAVLSHLADGIRCGDLYVIGSEEYADYREQLLPWVVCPRSI